MPATVVVKKPPVPAPPPKNINFATWEDAERAANSLAESGTVSSGTITVYEGTVQDVGGTPNTIDDGLPLLIDFTITMPWTSPDTGRVLDQDVPFHEVAGQLVNELDTKPGGAWVPSIQSGSNPPAGDMERR